MKRTWTVASATSYVLQNANNKSRGLKYCSAVDYLSKHGEAASTPTIVPASKKKTAIK